MMFLQVDQIYLGLEQMFCFCSQPLKIFINNKSQNIWNGQTDIINRDKYIWQVLNKMDKNYLDNFYLQIQYFNANIEYIRTYCAQYSSQMIIENKTEKISQLKFKSNPQQNSSLSKQHIKNAIKCLIQKFNDQEVKWVELNSEIIQISGYFMDNQSFQQMNTLLKTIVDKYEQNPHIGWLQLFQAGMMYYENKLPKQDYKTIIKTITLTIATYTLKTYQQNNNNIQQSRSNYKSIQQSSNEMQEQKQLIKQLQSIQVSGLIDQNEKIKDGNIQICEHWRTYVEIVRSYAFQRVKDLDNGDFWLFYELILSLVLDDALIQPNSYLCDPIIYEIIVKFKKIVALQIFNKIYHNIFHEICLFLRIYFYRMKQFLQKDSKIILPTPRYPLVNHCSLIMRFIQRQFTDQHISLSKQQKLDCLMLLTSIVSIKLPKSANYNQVLQFALQIEQLTSLKSSKISNTIFYCGQLISMIMYTNIDWVIQFCKKCKEHTQGKYLKRVLQIYKKGLMLIQRDLFNQQHQIYIYLRYILGFCGLMTVQKMDSYIQDVITDNFCHVVRILELIHGWEDQQQQNEGGISQFQEIKKNQQRNRERREEFYEQRMYLNSQKENKDFQMQEQKQQKDFTSNDADAVFWSEQFYNKNSLTSIEDADEIDIFKKSMIAVKNHNPDLFETLLHNFTQKQMMLWVVELEREEDESDDD